jgi:hypothetical protein
MVILDCCGIMFHSILDDWSQQCRRFATHISIDGLNCSKILTQTGKFGIYLLGLWVALFCAESLQMAIGYDDVRNSILWFTNQCSRLNSGIVPVFIVGLAVSAFILGIYMVCVSLESSTFLHGSDL